MLSKEFDNLLTKSNTKHVDSLANARVQPHRSVVSFSRAISCFPKKKFKSSPPPEGTKSVSVSGDRSFAKGPSWSRKMLAALSRGGMRVKEKLLVGVSIATVLFTLILVVDLQMDTRITGAHFPPSHARVRIGNEQFNSFRNRILKTNR